MDINHSTDSINNTLHTPPSSSHRHNSIQINLGRSRNALHELAIFINDYKPDFAFITEPYTGNQERMKLDNTNYTLYQFPTGRPTHAAIAIRKNFSSTLGMSGHSNSNLCIVQMKDHATNRTIFLISVYIEPRKDPYNTLDSLQLFLHHHPDSTFIICGDFNGWHSLWGSDTDNRRGNQIVDFVTTNDLTIHNSGNQPTFNTVTHRLPRSSIIDLTITSNRPFIHVQDWTVDPSITPSSDHNSIIFHLSFHQTHFTNNKKLSTYRYNTSHTDWNSIITDFTDMIEDKLPHTDRIHEADSHQLDVIINDMTNAILYTCDRLLPRARGRPTKPPFWNDHLQSLKLNVLKAHHKLSRYKRRGLPLDQLITERNDARRAYSDAFCTTSTEHFKSFCNRQTKEDVWSVTNRIIQTKPLSHPPSTLLLNDGSHTTNSLETANALIDNFFPPDTPDSTPSQQSIRTLTTTPIDTPPEPPFTSTEILNGLKHMSHKKAPGVDHLTADICLQFAIRFPNFLTSLYNRCLELSYFPTAWKRALIKIIPKPSKTNYSHLSSFRPIGLINVFGKLLERLIIDRLNSHLNTHNLHNSRQFGFKEQTSTTHAIFTALDLVRAKKSAGEHVIAVSLDIKAAFDNAWWPAILNRLRSYNCPSNIYQILLNYLSNRTVELNLADCNLSRNMSRGCIQGSVCGPTMWNLILDELLDLPLPPNCHIQAYADDVLLILHSPSLSTLQSTTNTALSQISAWGSSVKLLFGPDKTKITGFTNKTSHLNIYMDNTRIPFSNEIKYLGIIIDNKLKFTTHAINIIEKTKKLYYKLILFTRPTWGIHPDNIRVIYEQVITPIITYAASVWSNALRYKFVVSKLLSLQRLFAIKIIHGFRTCSTVTSISLAQLTPLPDKIKAVADIELAKLRGVSDLLPSDIPIEKPAPPSSLLHPSLRLPISFTEVNNTEEYNDLITHHSWRIFTDGSRHDDVVGAAFVATDPHGNSTTKKYKLHSTCSVFQAEMLAISKACQWILQVHDRRNPPPSDSFHIFSDSKSALTELLNPYSHNALAVEIFHSLHTARTRNIHIHFSWVRAHVGIPGNEMADSAAKHAASMHSQPTFYHTPISYLKTAKRKQLAISSQSFYENSPGSIYTKTLLPTHHDLCNFVNTIKLTFPITQFLTNHAYHKSYLHRFHITDNDTCPCNNTDPQTFDHLLHHCTRFSRTRLDFYITCDNELISPNDPLLLTKITDKTEILSTFINHLTHIINELKHFNNT